MTKQEGCKPYFFTLNLTKNDKCKPYHEYEYDRKRLLSTANINRPFCILLGTVNINRPLETSMRRLRYTTLGDSNH